MPFQKGISYNKGKIPLNRLGLVGKKFGRLLVTEFSYSKNRRTYWKCICDCGNEKEIMGKYLTGGDTQSCGCYQHDRVSETWKGKRRTEESLKKMAESKKGVYPSEKTRQKLSEAHKGEKHWNWKGGISYEPYCPVFSDQSFKSMILYRDRYICQNCGITNMMSLKVLDHNLCVHHIDYNKKNCELDNLITLCHRCNVKANNKRDYWQKYYTRINNKDKSMRGDI